MKYIPAPTEPIKAPPETWVHMRDPTSGAFSKCCIWVERDNFNGALVVPPKKKKKGVKGELPGPKSNYHPFLLVGFDTEFKGIGRALERDELEELGKNQILSYQVHCKLYDSNQPEAEEWSAICYPPNATDRLSLADVLTLAIWKGT